MMTVARWWLVSYDVRDPKRLRKTAKRMEGFGERIQYSLFRCWMDERNMEKLRWELTELLKPEDDVLMIPLCQRCVKGMRVTYPQNKKPDWGEQPEKHTIV